MLQPLHCSITPPKPLIPSGSPFKEINKYIIRIRSIVSGTERLDRMPRDGVLHRYLGWLRVKRGGPRFASLLSTFISSWPPLDTTSLAQFHVVRTRCFLYCKTPVTDKSYFSVTTGLWERFWFCAKDHYERMNRLSA